MKHVVLGTSFKAEVFEEHFGDGSELGLEIEYVVEDEPLGTGGGIRNVASHLRHDRAMIFNGDVLGGTDLGEVLRTHVEQEADVTLHLLRVSDPRAFGCVPTDSNGRVTAFLERPRIHLPIRSTLAPTFSTATSSSKSQPDVRYQWSGKYSRGCWNRASGCLGTWIRPTGGIWVLRLISFGGHRIWCVASHLRR